MRTRSPLKTRALVLCLAWAASFSLVACEGPGTSETRATGPSRVHDAETFFESTSISGGGFSHDARNVLYTSDVTGVPNVWSQPAEGGDPVQLTHSESASHQAVSYFPSDDRVLFTADANGDENFHLYVRGLDGSVHDLTPGDRTRASFMGWSRAGKSFFVSTNERDPRYMDVYQYSVGDDGYPRRRVFENTGGWGLGDISDNGRWLALSLSVTNRRSDLLVWDSHSPGTPPRRVGVDEEGGEDVVNQGAVFRPGSHELYYLSDAGSEFFRAWRLNLDTGARELVREAEWDVAFVGFSRDGRYRLTSINADAQPEIELVDLRDGSRVDLPSFPDRDLLSVTVARDGSKLSMMAGGDTSPPDLFTRGLRGGPLRQLTRALNSEVDAADLVAAEVVRFESYDGLEIPSLQYRPHGASAQDPVPAVVWMHGGPGGQSRRGYRAEIQFLLNHGYAVLAVNNRGSSGYGKTFFHMDDRAHGDVDLRDCLAAHGYLAGLDWVDGDRIAIEGGSYGGYLVVAALAFHPEVFDAGVDIFGVTNWMRTLTEIPAWWASFRAMLYSEMGDPAEDAERLHGISPLFHAGNIQRPLLVIQGAQDPRVHEVESREIVDAVSLSGVPVEYVLFDDEGHGFRQRKNRITAAKATLRFLNEHLSGSAQP